MDLEQLRVLAADGLILVDGQVLLLQRNHDPYKGHWVLPGGLVERDEPARRACKREIAEEVGIEVSVKQFIGLYDNPGRDPRGNVSAAFHCVPVDNTDPQPREEAQAVKLFDPKDLPTMGFDHGQIIADAFDRILNESGQG